MSTNTNTNRKPRTRRWQALTLTALLLAGGSLTIPQAAEAASSSSTSCKNWNSWCTQRITVVKKKSGNPVLLVRSNVALTDHPFYVMDQSRGGKVVCSGKLSWTGFPHRCVVPNRTSVLTIRVEKHLWEPITVSARAS